MAKTLRTVQVHTFFCRVCFYRSQRMPGIQRSTISGYILCIHNDGYLQRPQSKYVRFYCVTFDVLILTCAHSETEIQNGLFYY